MTRAKQAAQDKGNKRAAEEVDAAAEGAEEKPVAKRARATRGGGADAEAGAKPEAVAEPDPEQLEEDQVEGGAAEEAADGEAGEEQEGEADAEAGDGDEQPAEDGGDGEAADDAAAVVPAATDAPTGDPITLGYRSFKSGQEAYHYVSTVLKNWHLGQPLNEYELVMLLDLLKKGHPRGEEKLAGGVQAVTVMETAVSGQTSRCFHIVRPGGAVEDFSYRKCLDAIFPEMLLLDKPSKGAAFGKKGRGGGARGGRGGGGRGGGGRGGGGGGGRGARGGGRGGRGRGRGRG